MSEPSNHPASKDPMHGVTLKMIVTELVDHYGWSLLAEQIKINCFTQNPSIASSLKFLRRTPWAREKVEGLYQYTNFNAPSPQERAKQIWQNSKK